MTEEPKGAFDDLLAEARATPQEDDKSKGTGGGYYRRGGPNNVYRDRVGNGPPKELQPYHWQIIRLHLAGYRNGEVANEVGCVDETVSRTLKHPEAKRLKRELQEATEEHLHSLFPKAVGVVDDVMSETDPKLRLHAVDRWMGLVKQRSPEAPSVQVNVTNAVQVGAREKLVESLRNAADGEGDVIDADPAGEDGDGEA